MRRKYAYYAILLFLFTLIICGCIYLGKTVEVQINTENITDAEVTVDIKIEDSEDSEEEKEEISAVSKENAAKSALLVLVLYAGGIYCDIYIYIYIE